MSHQLWSLTGAKRRPDHNDRFYEKMALRAAAVAPKQTVAKPQPKKLAWSPPKLIELKRKGRAPTDLTGKRFGRLAVVSLTKRRAGRGQYVYNVICECGMQKMVAAKVLRQGFALSCGCLMRELSIATASRLQRTEDGRFICEAA